MINMIVPDWPDAPPGIGALSSLRSGGVSRAPYDDGAGGGGLNFAAHVGDAAADVACNRALLQRLVPSTPRWLSQVHGSQVVNAATINAGGTETQADASVTDTPGVVCAILSADCLPVLLTDIHGQVVGAAHAGWRGLAGGVLQQTVLAMRALGAAELTAWMGPAIGPQRFEVGSEVLRAFEDSLAATGANVGAAFTPITGKPDRYLADIYRLAIIALNTVAVHRISGGNFCTMSDSQRFYSYRRDAVTGRMATMIWIK